MLQKQQIRRNVLKDTKTIHHSVDYTDHVIKTHGYFTAYCFSILTQGCYGMIPDYYGDRMLI